MNSRNEGKLTLTEMKRESKSFEALQQGILIAILSSYGYSFDLKRPERMAEKTFQYLTINEVYFNNQPLNFGRIIEEFCEQQFQLDKTEDMTPNQLKIVKRRKDLNRTAISFSWLLQYAEQNGVSFGKRKTKQAKKTVQLPKIYTVTMPNASIAYTKKEIEEIGASVQNHICSLFVKKQKELFIPAYYQFFNEMLGLNILQANTTESVHSEDLQIVQPTMIMNSEPLLYQICVDPSYCNPSYVYPSNYPFCY
ncbi:hypothetical protein EHI8A_040820 [Entamoeba histolytica HM-1:IMSS-B]|uniref:Uncharacterized protein n=7 Tax=Entamoeba TaxID=5758 RepID=C4M6E0_ENTH1|nr:hypothetical protein EHI_142930 [Entamoeba histolytica HM-1:IMSS]EMD47114.1 Hypothetical protein EHI5A_017290 [Entamoeba histolytica KU27]EMH75917.1 hypothetical protein EHI8A_040820 [Entamoeba histolytica HM-1:IMSS-B]EMS12900.1 hypothetical protein KM1_023350 [Entamoeba histolytica HM-3:IMSS]ENY62118.1 hypothetical protein EHI7A_041900 [Entamoeba histolytica HM-1:IMSS-A]GAT97042.1 hypothetical protein CL6EHI_142930 [Entamoeba histolytica]|eukprot:XP_649696.1 hypothetical protein EHI_142930 [Entamoeba histolytica HM-1:IMSS]